MSDRRFVLTTDTVDDLFTGQSRRRTTYFIGDNSQAGYDVHRLATCYWRCWLSGVSQWREMRITGENRSRQRILHTEASH